MNHLRYSTLEYNFFIAKNYINSQTANKIKRPETSPAILTLKISNLLDLCKYDFITDIALPTRFT